MSLLNNLLIGCKQATFLHEKKKEGKLSMSQGIGLWIHLGYCRFCRAFIKQIEVLALYTKKMQDAKSGQNVLTPGKKSHLQEAFNQQLKNY